MFLLPSVKNKEAVSQFIRWSVYLTLKFLSELICLIYIILII
jgi:hypothetical protein